MIIRRPSLFQFWMLISILWLVVAGGVAVLNWPGEDYTKRFSELSFLRAPDDWRDQHPECMDRYGFWPDGQRMERSEFEVMEGFGIWSRELLNDMEKDLGTTPEQQARDEWANLSEKKYLPVKGHCGCRAQSRR